MNILCNLITNSSNIEILNFFVFTSFAIVSYAIVIAFLIFLIKNN